MPATTAPPPQRRVPFDPEIAPVVAAMAAQGSPQISHETLESMRESAPIPSGLNDDLIAGRAIDWADHTIPGPPGAPSLELTVFRPRGAEGETRPALYHLHGGGMIGGHRTWEHGRIIDLVENLGVVAVTASYRFAPENPYPAGFDDCYTGFEWLAHNAPELGVDPERIVVMGGSAGGGFAAAVALRSRDHQGPRIAGQLLLCPMLDNTNTSAASHQYDGTGTWQRAHNLFAWSCVLGQDATSPDAPAYAAPARATDLADLPPAFIEAGSAELFRDENAAYATRIWEAGGQAELHVWAGGCHGFDIYAPHAEITRAALAVRESWLRRVLEV